MSNLETVPAGGRVQIIDTTIPVVEYRGQRVITLAIMDLLHRRPEGTAKRTFQQCKDRLEEGKHFYLIDFAQKNEFRPFGIEVPPRGLIVLTERGYSMLVKSFTDDFAWEVQEQLSDSYFDNQKQMTMAEFLYQQAGIMVEHERKLKSLQEQQNQTNAHLVQTKAEIREVGEKAERAFEAATAALRHKFGRSGYYTVLAYGSSIGASVDLTLAKALGAQASQLSKQRGVELIKVPDERYGKVNSYHESILEEVFKLQGLK